MKEELELTHFEANSFAGIDRSSPVVIDFTAARKKGIALLTGDQGTGKSSTLLGIMNLMGAAFNVDTKSFINKLDEDIDASLEFVHEGAKYKVTQSGSRLSLKRYYEETDRYVPEGSPKETLRKIFGNLGVSPMFLKEQEGKKQIEWFKRTFGNDEDISKKEKKVTDAYTLAFSQRKEVNRAIKEIKGFLANSKLYENREKNYKKFAEPISMKKEQDKVSALQEKKQDLDRAKNKLETLAQNEKHHESTIERLERELAAERSALATVKENIVKGKKFVADLASVKEEYEQANIAFLNISKTIAEQTEWKTVLKKEKELDEMEQASLQASAQIDALRSELLALTSSYLPKIKGLEIRTKGTSLDAESEDEGIYYEDKSLAQLSESELWTLFMKIWEKMDVYFVFCENVSSLGSEAIATLNRLVKEDKARVLASAMDRKKKEMQITFVAKID